MGGCNFFYLRNCVPITFWSSICLHAKFAARVCYCAMILCLSMMEQAGLMLKWSAGACAHAHAHLVKKNSTRWPQRFLGKLAATFPRQDGRNISEMWPLSSYINSTTTSIDLKTSEIQGKWPLRNLHSLPSLKATQLSRHARPSYRNYGC